ncbi:MAG: hypothetical protein DMG11_21780 [Acidobacteria bacterium]|nr:MAG: hypothetical protein DMG11_21780 [Acidobacteriota bacterium]
MKRASALLFPLQPRVDKRRVIIPESVIATALLASYRPKKRSIGNTKRPIWPGKAKRVRRKPSTDVGHRDRESQIMIMMRGIATVKAES